MLIHNEGSNNNNEKKENTKKSIMKTALTILKRNIENVYQ